jgi:DNA-binding beta-propeller fold protein YncE
LPNAPRIQHLRTFTGEGDVAKQTSDFARFIVGDAQSGVQLQQPYGVAMYDGKLYVADSKGPGLMVFDLKQNRFSLITGTGNGRMKRPINVTIDRDGTKYVTDTGRDQVLVFDEKDRFVTAFGAEGEFKPVDTAIAGDRLYVADIRHHQIQVLDKRTGRLLFKFGKAGSKEGELFHPTNLALGPDGDIYVVETSNFRVQRFTPDGKFVRIYGEVGTAPGRFTRPKGIAIDRAGRLYVGDSAFENVQIFDPSGKLLLYFGQPGDRAEGLNLPAGVAIDYDNVDLFKPYADPRFALEYVILVASQFGPNKVDVFGFGRMRGMSYSPDESQIANTATNIPR